MSLSVDNINFKITLQAVMKDKPDWKMMIDSADDAALRKFLKTQVRRDRDLAIRLWAHLIDTEGGVNLSGIRRLLESTLRYNTKGELRLGKKDLVLLRDVVAKLEKMQAQCLSGGALRETWEIGDVLCTHLHKVIDRIQGPDNTLVSVLIRSYQNIRGLLARDPAPELRDSVRKGIFRLLGRKSYRIYSEDHNAVTCLLRTGLSADDHIALIRIVREHYLSSRQDIGYAMVWGVILCTQCISMPEEANCIDDEHLWEIVKYLYNQGSTDAADRQVLYRGIPSDLSYYQIKPWLTWRYEAAERSGDADATRIAGIDLLVGSRDLSIYDVLKEKYGSHVAGECLSHPGITSDVKAYIFAQEKHWEALETYLGDTCSIALPGKYSDALITHRAVGEAFFAGILNRYVLRNAGPQCKEAVHAFFEVLRSHGHEHLASCLATGLREKYPERFEEYTNFGEKHPQNV